MFLPWLKKKTQARLLHLSLHLPLHLHLHQDRQNPDNVVSLSRAYRDTVGTHSGFGVDRPLLALRAVYSSACPWKFGIVNRLNVSGVGESTHTPSTGT